MFASRWPSTVKYTRSDQEYLHNYQLCVFFISKPTHAMLASKHVTIERLSNVPYHKIIRKCKETKHCPSSFKLVKTYDFRLIDTGWGNSARRSNAKLSCLSCQTEHTCDWCMYHWLLDKIALQEILELSDDLMTYRQ